MQKPSSFTSRVLPLIASAFLATGCDKDTLVEGPIASTMGSIHTDNTGNTNCAPQPPLVAEYMTLVRDQLSQCTGCHSAEGIAGSAWRGHDSARDNLKDLQRNFDSFFAVAAKTEPTGPQGEPFIVAYPTDKTQKQFPNGKIQKHGGGIQSLTAEQVAAIVQFVDHATHVDPSGQASSLKAVTDCYELGQLTEAEFFEGVGMHDANGIVMKFLRDVTGGALPAGPLQIKNKEELKAMLRQITYQRGFYDWLKWRFNDLTLTRFYRDGSDAKNLMGNRYGMPWNVFDNKEVADGPGNRFAFIVRDNRSIQELVTGRYYVIPNQNPNPADPDENWVARLQAFSTDTEPLSGIVTDPLWQARFPTTDTNIGRHRAEYVLRNFADIRVLDTASRVVQAPANADLPTLTYPACAQCHTGTPLDSVAASFWDYQKESGYKHNSKLPAPFLSINFGGVGIPKDDSDRLGKMMYLISQEKGFARSMANMAYSMLMNRSPMKRPVASEADYNEHMRHFEVENAFLDSMANFLTSNGYNFRELVVEMATSRWFAANGRLSSKPSPSRKAELKGIGPNMAPPEVLAMRLRQLFANDVFPTKISNLVTHAFVTELGGIDSKNVKVRSTTPNAPNELVRDFLAFEVDKLVVRELSRPPQQRYLLKDLDFTSLEPPVYPVDDKPIPGNEMKYRLALANIQRLAFGKFVDPNAPEITVEYNKWIALWKLTLQDLGNGKIASTHRVQGASSDDPQGLVRTWGAYVATIVQGVEFGLY